MLTVVDYFCGMGGSSSGLAEAGYTIKVAANHWDRAIETFRRLRAEASVGRRQAFDVTGGMVMS